MSHRVGLAILVALGVMLAIGLLLLGLDLSAAARTGPRWKRRIVGLGLTVLAAAGIAPAVGDSGTAVESRQSAERKPEAPAASVPADLSQLPEWHKLMDVWNEANRIIHAGGYPFDKPGKARLLEKLNQAVRSIADLQSTRSITEAEAGLLRADLGLVTDQVQGLRTKEMSNITCYAIVAMPYPALVSLDRLSARVAFLEKEAASTRLQPVVLAKVLDRIQKDVDELGQAVAKKELPPERLSEAGTLVKSISAQLARIHERLTAGTNQLQSSKQWPIIMEAWKSGADLIGKSTTEQRKAADCKAEKARQAMDELVRSDLLSLPERDLLVCALNDLHDAVYRTPPTDLTVICYEAAVYSPPASESMGRLAKRIPLLGQLVERGTLHEPVLRKILFKIQADVDVLSNDKKLDALKGEDRNRAAALGREGRSLLEDIQALQGKPVQ